MKRMFLTLVCAAFASTAWAQTPLPKLPAAPTTTATTAKVVYESPIQQTSGNRFVGSHCAEQCCTPTKTICVAEPSVKVTVKVNYSSVCEKICFPKCTLFGGCGCDSGCDNGQCNSHIYQRKYLVKRVCTTECPTTKCVAIEVPACDSGHSCQGALGAPVYGSAPVMEKIGQPMPVKK